VSTVLTWCTCSTVDDYDIFSIERVDLKSNSAVIAVARGVIN